jgi:hypothetical protein
VCVCVCGSVGMLLLNGFPRASAGAVNCARSVVGESHRLPWVRVGELPCPIRAGIGVIGALFYCSSCG